VVEVLGQIGAAMGLGVTALADAPPAAGAAATAVGRAPSALALPIVFLPLLGVILVGLCAAMRVRSKLPAWITVACLGAAFAFTLALYQKTGGGAEPGVAHAWDWINFRWGKSTAQSLVANFSFYIDSLTLLWMLFVTGLATLIALYASEYMAHDVGPGFNRFYAAFGLFVFSMACLVMGDNLLLLYLGWEGVGLCSYLLIGYFYKKPSAVAAAKKAFIMNRIGDLGLALGIMLTFVQFGTLEYAKLWPMIQPYAEAALSGRLSEVPVLVQLIPVLFTVGAFGKSAQIPLYVWLPDAMEGPTPVSALIHAATMVTAGVYLVARFLPLYQASEWALPIVAWVGTLTALLAATIGMAQFDIKRIMAYSTVSQLGYMFAGLGVVSLAATEAPAGAVFHVFTHAFFKATLFLCCGAVMHGFAGQLDLRRLSGVAWMKGWGIVGVAMLIGCLNLAGFPFTAGYFSKDMILAEAFTNPATSAIGWVLLLTAGLTAYYTFRVFFRVFVGPKEYHPGDEHHGHAGDHDHGHGHGHETGPEELDAEEAALAEESHGGEFHPHAPGWAINLVLAVLAVASIVAAVAYPTHWVADLAHNASTYYGLSAVHAADAAHHGEAAGHAAHGAVLGFNPHEVMYYISAAVGAIGIGIAYLLHLKGRRTAETAAADKLLPMLGPIPRWAQNKWYVDEFYNAVVRLPLLAISHIFRWIDALLVDGLVNLFGYLPRGTGGVLRPTQSGVLHDYALKMAAGVGIVLAVAAAAMGGAL